MSNFLNLYFEIVKENDMIDITELLNIELGFEYANIWCHKKIVNIDLIYYGEKKKGEQIKYIIGYQTMENFIYIEYDFDKIEENGYYGNFDMEYKVNGIKISYVDFMRNNFNYPFEKTIFIFDITSIQFMKYFI
jgi:hypothetical protein